MKNVPGFKPAFAHGFLFLKKTAFASLLMATAATASGQDIWTGATDLNWHTATNWQDGSVPTASDDVEIPVATISPTIVLTGAVAKSVRVFSGGILTVNETGDLTINNSRSFTGGTSAFLNEGQTIIKGKITLGSTASVGNFGFRNKNFLTITAPGVLQIDRAINYGLYHETGTATNNGKVTIGSLAAVGFVGMTTTASFTNSATGEIRIDRATNNGLYVFSGTLTNAGYVLIGANALTSANAVEVSAGATLNLSTCSALLDIRSNNVILNNGTITNSGSIIENASGTSSITTNNNVVQNLGGGTFNITTNNGTISDIAGCVWTGCASTNWATTGNWHNRTVPTATAHATVPDQPNDPILTTTGAAKTLWVGAYVPFQVTSSGVLSINGARVIGGVDQTFFNEGTVTNGGTIRLGNASACGLTGYHANGYFTNQTGALFQIDRTTDRALFVETGSLTNNGTVRIGSLASVGNYGIEAQAFFTNAANAVVEIDRCDIYAIGAFFSQGIFTNNGKVTIGAISLPAPTAVRAAFQGQFQNTGCAALLKISSNSILSNAATISNSGNIIENASGTSTMTANSGAIQNLNGGTFTIGSNTGLMTTGSEKIWTGCTSTDWATATNWIDGAAPTTASKIEINNVTNDPVVAGAGNVAHSVWVKSGGSLGISASATLAVNGFQNVSGSNCGFCNFGTLTNSGQLFVGNVSNAGQYAFLNKGSVTNQTGATINLDRGTENALYGQLNSTFTNHSNLIIGNAASTFPLGFRNQGEFLNTNNCAVTTVFNGLHNDYHITNHRYISVENGEFTPTGTELVNFGAIIAKNGPAIFFQDNTTNFGTILGELSANCRVISLALMVGNGAETFPDENWYFDAAHTQLAATYAQGANTLALEPSAPQSTWFDLHFTVTHQGSGCSWDTQIKRNYSDIQAPNVNCPANITVSGPHSIDPPVFDNCPLSTTWGAQFSGNPNGNPANFSGMGYSSASAPIAFLNGTTTVTLTATDGLNVANSCSFLVHSTVALPVELVYFEGKKGANANVLNWKTASEANVHAHVIERSADGENWQEVARLAAKGQPNADHFYEWADFSIPNRAFYRLKTMDFDGHFSLSNIVFLERENHQLTASPSPTDGPLDVFYDSENEKSLLLEVFSTIGQLVFSQKTEVEKGQNALRLDLGDLPNGIYFIRAGGEGDLSGLVRVVVAK